jgi:hypothetical protein
MPMVALSRLEREAAIDHDLLASEEQDCVGNMPRACKTPQRGAAKHPRRAASGRPLTVTRQTLLWLVPENGRR